jgi:NAD(P)-dependent dehydrogenase (short-subunit alcohol dehydrogenase family)
MRILVIGTGTIGRAVVAALSAGNEIISASLRSTTLKVDIADPASIQQMYRSLGKLDAVVCAAGPAKFAPLARLSDADFRFSLDNKLMGQAKRRAIRFRACARRWVIHAYTRQSCSGTDARQCGRQSA